MVTMIKVYSTVINDVTIESRDRSFQDLRIISVTSSKQTQAHIE